MVDIKLYNHSNFWNSERRAWNKRRFEFKWESDYYLQIQDSWWRHQDQMTAHHRQLKCNMSLHLYRSSNVTNGKVDNEEKWFTWIKLLFIYSLNLPNLSIYEMTCVYCILGAVKQNITNNCQQLCILIK